MIHWMGDAMNTLLLLFVLAQEGPRGGKIEWRRDVDDALAQAKKDGRPAMLYFTADW